MLSFISRYKSLSLGLGVIVLILAGCGSDQSDHAAHGDAVALQSYEAVGVVKTITPTKNYINIDHEAIPGFMDAMAMFFAVSDTSILRNVAVDDSIRFTVEVKNGNAEVSGVELIK